MDGLVTDKAAEYAPTPEPQRRPRFARFRRGRHRLTHPGQLTVARISFRHFDAATVQLPVVARQGAL